MAGSIKNTRISTKITAVLSILVILVCGTGLFAVNQLMETRGTTLEVTRVWLPSVRYLGDIRYNMARHRAIIARHLMVASLEDKADIEKRAKVAANNVDIAGQRYEPLIPAADAREAYAALLPAWKAYLAECEKMLEASRNGDGVRAMKIFVSEVSVAGLNTERNLERLVELNLKGAGEAEAVGDGIYSESRNLVFGAIGLAVLFAIAATVFLRMSIARPIIIMTDAMTKLAQGDLNINVPSADQTDEIGNMAYALLVFKEQAIKGRAQAEREKELEQEARDARKSAVMDMANTVECETTEAVESIAATAREVDVAAQQMVQFVASVSIDTQSVAAASEEALTNAQTVSAAAEQLSSSIREIAGHITRTTQITQRAVASGRTASKRSYLSLRLSQKSRK